VVERRLKESKYLGCDEYTIADMAAMPWMRFPERQGVDISEYPNVQRWRDGIAARPAVAKALQVLADRRRPEMSKEQKEVLFGATQYAKR
jgi:GST-like protein